MSNPDVDIISQFHPDFIRYVTDDEFMRYAGCNIKVRNSPLLQRMVEMADELRSCTDTSSKEQFEVILLMMHAVQGDCDGYTMRDWYLTEHCKGTDKPGHHELNGNYRELYDPVFERKIRVRGKVAP